jgi:pyridinium-3,5-bisthiocarboxylic acid mononucleotide nickel chelatase
MKIAYFDCFAGISGNMALAAVADAGIGPQGIRQALLGLKLPGYRLRFTRRREQGLAGLHLEVEITARRHRHRNLDDIARLIRQSRLPAEVKAKSLAVFSALARAEAKVHRKPLGEVHFHEVGAVDAIVDVVGTVAGLCALKADRVLCSPLPLGRGEVRCEHGLLPVPAPATLALLEGVPVLGGVETGEMVTPTGAALVRTLAEDFGPLPALILGKTGVGLGDRKLAGRPNLLRLLTGETGPGDETVVEFSSNLDDFPAERFEYLMEQLFAAGALDVALLPAQMKKNRQGALLQVLARPQDRPAIIRTLLLHSTTLGVRYRELYRTTLPRRIETVATRFGRVRVKWARRPDGMETAHPESDDLYRLARRTGRPLSEIEDAVRRHLGGRRSKPKRA